MSGGLEQDIVAKLTVVVEVFVALGEGKDALLELAVPGVDDFALVPVIGEEFGCAGEKVEAAVDFAQKENAAIRADLAAFEVSLNFMSLAV